MVPQQPPRKNSDLLSAVVTVSLEQRFLFSSDSKTAFILGRMKNKADTSVNNKNNGNNYTHPKISDIEEVVYPGVHSDIEGIFAEIKEKLTILQC